MGPLMVEGVVENGVVRLTGPVVLPENVKVYVVVPGLPAPPAMYVRTPRLARPGDAAKFTKQVIDLPTNDGPV